MRERDTKKKEKKNSKVVYKEEIEKKEKNWKLSLLTFFFSMALNLFSLTSVDENHSIFTSHYGMNLSESTFLCQHFSMIK
jgi:hypothetical protein